MIVTQVHNSNNIYIYIYIYTHDTTTTTTNNNNNNNNTHAQDHQQVVRRFAETTSPRKSRADKRRDPGSLEFTKGGLVKGGLAIYAFPLCNCNTSGSVFNVQIENLPNC